MPAISRFARKVDSNQPAIIAELKRLGASVLVISCSEKGAPDLLVGFRGLDQLAEVKPDTPRLAGHRRLTQLMWAAEWQGRGVVVLRTAGDCLDLICRLATDAEDFWG